MHCTCVVHIFCLPWFRKVKKGTLLIDSSTIDPAVAKDMAVAAEKMGAVFMDAPVSGGKALWLCLCLDALHLWRICPCTFAFVIIHFSAFVSPSKFGTT